MHNKISRIALLGVMALFLSLSTACSYRVDPGYGGIVVDLNGEDRGVDDIVVTTGRIWYNPIGKSVYQIPHFMQRVAWTATAAEGSKDNEEITFNSVEGTVIKTDVGFAWSVKKERIPHVFVEFRTTVASIEDGYLRSQVRGAIAECAETKPLALIYGAEKSAISKCAFKAVGAVPFIANNFDLEYLTFIGAFRFDPAVQTAINKKITAENNAEAVKLEADGKADAKRTLAQADADAIRLVATANRDAKFAAAEGNAKLSKTLNADILKFQEIQMYDENWDGKLSKVMMGAGGGALISLDMNDS